MATSALRPLSLGELLDRTFFLFRKHFLLFVGITAVPHLLLLAFQLINVAFRPPGLGFSITSSLWSVAISLLFIPVFATSQGATVIAVSKVHLGRQTTVSESLSSIKGRIVGLSLIMLGVGIGLGIAFLLLLIPGIILGLMWALWLPVAVLEDTGLVDSTSRSAELTKGSRGRIFVICFLLIVLVYIVYVLWEVPILALLGIFHRGYNPLAGPPRWFLIAMPIGSFLTSCLVSPLLTIALTVTYYDQRVRKEGFDLQLMMSTLDAPQSGATPGTSPVST
jgi:glycerophosphoryl diester phosphodiesterase family protein